MLVVALLVSLVEMPEFVPKVFDQFNPSLVFLVCYYFGFREDIKISLVLPFIVGLIMDIHFGFPIGLNALLFSTTSFVAMLIPQQSKKNTLKNQLIGLVALFIVVEISRTFGLILYSEHTITIDYRSAILSVLATLVTWFVVNFVLERWIYKDPSNISF